MPLVHLKFICYVKMYEMQTRSYDMNNWGCEWTCAEITNRYLYASKLPSIERA